VTGAAGDADSLVQRAIDSVLEQIPDLVDPVSPENSAKYQPWAEKFAPASKNKRPLDELLAEYAARIAANPDAVAGRPSAKHPVAAFFDRFGQPRGKTTGSSRRRGRGGRGGGQGAPVAPPPQQPQAQKQQPQPQRRQPRPAEAAPAPAAQQPPTEGKSAAARRRRRRPSGRRGRGGGGGGGGEGASAGPSRAAVPSRHRPNNVRESPFLRLALSPPALAKLPAWCSSSSAASPAAS
jgi:ribonuclease E